MSVLKQQHEDMYIDSAQVCIQFLIRMQVIHTPLYTYISECILICPITFSECILICLITFELFI